MKSLLRILFISPTLIFGQELSHPEISVNSGFFDSTFQVNISHPDPSVRILYTLDGSEPNLDNLDGKEWNYKTTYPIFPGDDYGKIHQDTVWTYEYSDPITMENRTLQETVLSDVYTSVLGHNVYAEGELFKANILRARAYSNISQEYSETVSRNYFIEPNSKNRYTIPVVSISMDNDAFYGYEDGIGVPGILFDEWRADNPNAPRSPFAPANFRLRGSATELNIHFNYFDNGNEILNHNAGLRINGGYSRSFPNKSFRLYAKNKYGKKNFEHEFFENYPINTFKRFIIRNSGNDGFSSFFRDALAHRVSKNLNLDIQESQPIVVLINGEYNGLRNIRERYDKKYFESVHDIPEMSLDFLENHTDIKEGDLDFYHQMQDYFTSNSFQDDVVYENAITYLDPVNFTDYYAANIYVANDDWPSNNYLFYRHKTTYNSNNAEEGVKDGRFRWLLKDLDRGFHLASLFENSHEGNTLEWATQKNQATLLIRRLLENANYKQYFINRFADLLNTSFKEERVLSIIEEFENLYRPEIEENGRRWHNFTSMPPTWQEDVNSIKTFALNRPEFQREHIIQQFDLDGVFELVLNVSNEQHGFIHLNTIDILPSTDGIDMQVYPWSGNYFWNVPVTIKAIPKEGYKFSHWSGVSNVKEEEITLTLNEDSYIKANFIPQSINPSDYEKLKVVLYPNPTNDKIFITSQTSWKNFIIYDLKGKEIKSGLIVKETIDVNELMTGTYFIQLETKEGFIKHVRVIKK